MSSSRAELEAAVAAAFAPGDAPSVLALLDRYGTEPHERERERVQLAIVALSQGKPEKVADLVQTAKRDYRDVLCWAQAGPISEEELLRQQEMARQLIAKWGRKPQ